MKIVEHKYKDGVVFKRTTYVDGKRNGLEERFERNGSLGSKAFFVDDKMHGDFVVYSDGKILEVVPFVHGKKHGIGKVYLSPEHSCAFGLYVHRNGSRQMEIRCDDDLDIGDFPENRVLFGKKQWKEICNKA